MQGSLSQSTHTPSSSVSLGESHGYRFEGDTAILNAELAIAPAGTNDGLVLSQQYALQLWACETPHQGGPVRGIKVAEAALALPHALPDQENREHLEAAAAAQLPPVQREYAMVMVLASGRAGAYDQVHDFSNYQARQQFAGPHLEGSVGYRVEDDAVVLQAEKVRNPRARDNLSGSLALQLWALPAPYTGGAFSGALLASAELDRLAGQAELHGVAQRVARARPVAGTWCLSLMLREWTSAGYVTRDYCNFAELYVETEASGELAASLDGRRDGPHREALRPEHDVAGVEERWDNEPRANDGPHGVAHDEPLQGSAVQGAAERAMAPVADASPDLAGKPQSAPRAPEVESARMTEAPAGEVAAVAQRAARAQQNGVQPLVQPPKHEAVPKAAPAAVARQTPTPAATAARPAQAARVSVQTASVEELAKVPGLNKKLAQAIVRARPMSSLDELKTVRGIGDRMLQQLRGLLTL
jgi:DNA uptake protein ComE-like DNA-binding protein